MATCWYDSLLLRLSHRATFHQSATMLLRSPCFLFLVWGIFYCLKVALQPICLEALKQYRVALLSSNSSQERPNINFSVYFLRVCTSAMAFNRGTRAPPPACLSPGRAEGCLVENTVCTLIVCANAGTSTRVGKQNICY